jgi:ATP-dependent Clp protease ATP-binding subunit ClpA
MWQRFTEAARKAVFYAQEEAQGLGEGYVSTEHLLLGLLREANTATRVLDRLMVSPEQVANRIKAELPDRKREPRQMTLTPRAKRVIDLAYEEARGMDHNHIGSEHLLLGIIREGDGFSGRVLASFDVNLEKARQIVIEMSLKAEKEATPPRPESGGIKHWFTKKSGPVLDDVGEIAHSPRLRAIANAARDDARRREIRLVGTHDWLWQMLEDEQSLAFRVLSMTEIDLARLREALSRLRELPAVDGEPEASPFARVMEQGAKRASLEVGARQVTTAHVLVAMSGMAESLGGMLLRKAGICQEHLYVLAAQIGDDEPATE